MFPFKLFTCPMCGNTGEWTSYRGIIQRYKPATWYRKHQYIKCWCSSCKATWQMRCKADDELVNEVLASGTPPRPIDGLSTIAERLEYERAQRR